MTRIKASPTSCAVPTCSTTRRARSPCSVRLLRQCCVTCTCRWSSPLTVQNCRSRMAPWRWIGCRFSPSSLARGRTLACPTFAPTHARRSCGLRPTGGASAGCAHLQWPPRSDSTMADDTDIPTLRRILHDNQRIAIVGISAEWHRPSYFAGKYMLAHGYTVIPVNPKYESVLGQPCFPSLRVAREKAGPIDLVDCFRRAEDVEPLVE